MNRFWLLTSPSARARQGQITLRENGVITPRFIVFVELDDFVTRITLSIPICYVEPRGSSAVETADIDGGEVVLFSWVLDEFFRVTKAWQVSRRLHRDLLSLLY